MRRGLRAASPRSRPVVVFRQRSLNHSSCSGLPPGMKRDVKTWRNVGIVAAPGDAREIDHRLVRASAAPAYRGVSAPRA